MGNTCVNESTSDQFDTQTFTSALPLSSNSLHNIHSHQYHRSNQLEKIEEEDEKQTEKMEIQAMQKKDQKEKENIRLNILVQNIKSNLEESSRNINLSEKDLNSLPSQKDQANFQILRKINKINANFDQSIILEEIENQDKLSSKGIFKSKRSDKISLKSDSRLSIESLVSKNEVMAKKTSNK